MPVTKAKKMTVSPIVVSYSMLGTVYFLAKNSFESATKKQARVPACTNKSYSVAPIKPITVWCIFVKCVRYSIE